MKSSKQIRVFVCCLLACMYSAHSAAAGTIVMTTSDGASTLGAGTYVKDTNMVAEVIIDTTSTVTFDVKDTNGAAVYVTYSLPSGTAATSDTGYATAEEKITISFASTSYGKISEFDLTVSHDNTGMGNGQCTSSKVFKYKVCIPQISVPADSGTNTYGVYAFNTHQTVVGCDDFTQLDYDQLYNESSSYQSNSTGQAINPPSGNSGGYIEDTVGGVQKSWDVVDGGVRAFDCYNNQARLEADRHDLSLNSSPGTITTGTPPRQYAYYFIINQSIDFKTRLRRHKDSYVLSGCEYDWGYTWDTKNLTWGDLGIPGGGRGQGGGTPPRPASLAAATLLGLAPGSGKGEFISPQRSSDGKFQIPAF